MARKGAGSGGTPDKVGHRENQPIQVIMVSRTRGNHVSPDISPCISSWASGSCRNIDDKGHSFQIIPEQVAHDGLPETGIRPLSV